MKLFLHDFETTGIDPKTCRPIEFFGRLWDTETDMKAEAEFLLYASDYPEVTQEITTLTGITAEEVKTQGQHPRAVMEKILEVAAVADWFVAHNGRLYDKIVLESECARHGLTVPPIRWLDTRMDLPYPERLRCRVLSHVALEHGYTIDPSKLHRARADVDLMELILRKYDLAEVVRVASAPFLYLKAGVKYDSREKAKARGFRWCQFDDSSPRWENTWIKKIRDFQLEDERKAADFPISILEVF